MFSSTAAPLATGSTGYDRTVTHAFGRVFMLALSGVLAGHPARAMLAEAPGHMWGYEAAGDFRHVAGSACCHPVSDPRPVPEEVVEEGLGICQSRCEDYEPCDAFVFSPSSRLCFLIRYTSRQKGRPIEPSVRLAEDRVFGLVDRTNVNARARSQEKSPDRKQGAAEGAKKGRKSKSKQRRRHNRVDLEGAEFILDAEELLGAGVFGAGLDDLEFVFGEGSKPGERAHGSDRSGKGKFEEQCFTSAEGFDEQCFVFGQGHGAWAFEADAETCADCDAFDWEDLLSRASFRQSSRNASSTSEEGGNGGSEAEGHGEEEWCVDIGAREWENQFRRAHQRVWPSRGACLRECRSECNKDVEEMRRQTMEFLKKVLGHTFGEHGHYEYVFDFADGDDEEDVLCAETCESLCDEFDSVGNISTAARQSTAGDPETSENATAAMEASARKVAELLRRALQKAGARLSDAIAEGGEHSSLFVPSLAPPVESLLPESVDTLDLSALLGDGSALKQEQLQDDSAAQQFGAITTVGSPELGATMMGIQPTTWPALDLQPSTASLFQGLPATSRWAGGSAPFLQRLLGRAATRLGLLLPGVSNFKAVPLR